jgi:hypothetical protein
MKHHFHGKVRAGKSSSPKHSPPPSPTQRVASLLAQRVTLRCMAVLIAWYSMVRFHATYQSTLSATTAASPCFHPLLGESLGARCLPSVTSGIVPTTAPLMHHNPYPRIVFLYSTHRFNTTTPDNERQSQWSRNRTVADMGDPRERHRIAKRDNLQLDTVENETCHLRYAWQKTSFPTCNVIHEFDGAAPWTAPSRARHDKMGSSVIGRHKLYRMIGYGFWRDVWIVHGPSATIAETAIFKTMRYIHDYTPRNYDRMRRDAVAMERLSASPFIVDLYAYCGTSSFSEYGNGGDIPDALWPRGRGQEQMDGSSLTQVEKLRIGTCILFCLGETSAFTLLLHLPLVITCIHSIPWTRHMHSDASGDWFGHGAQY